ncbi:WD40-repeat-containing domain protein [Phlyctochytrium arcticum]|nr:WD40-repeat-containing domain protein [Phlyctochytrium arcticum]
MVAVQYGNLHLKTHFKKAKTIESIFTGGKAAITKDETLLITPVGDDINVLSLETGQKVFRLEGNSDSVTCVAASPSGVHLVSASQSLLLKLWNLESGDEVRSWKAHEAPVITMDFDQSSTLVATGSADSTVKVWDVDAGYCTHNFKGHSGIISVVKFHPDQEHLRLVSASDDCTIRVWDLHKRSCIAVLDSHVSVVRGLDFSADGGYLISGGRDKVVNIWNMKTGEVAKTLPIFESVESVGLLSSDSDVPLNPGIERPKSIVYTAGDKGLIRLWDVDTGNCIFEQKSKVDSKHDIVDMIYLKTSNVLVAITSDQNILFYDLSSGLEQKKQIAGYNQEILDLRFAGPEDKHLAVITNTEQVRVYNTDSLDCSILFGHSEIVMCIDRSSDGLMLASGSRDNTVRIWKHGENNTFQCAATCIGHTEPVSTLAFSRKTSKFLVTGSHDRTIKVWDVPEMSSTTSDSPEKLKTRYTFLAHDKDIQTVAVAPNDKVFASGGLDKTAKLWSTEDGKLLGTFKGHRRGLWTVAFSPVDQILATSSTDKTIKLWNVNDFTCVKTFEGHLNSVLRVSFISSGMQLISSGSDGLVKLWTIRNNECVATLDGHDDRIWALAVQRGEKYVASGSSDSTIVLWEDMTIEESEKKMQEEEERVTMEQDLSNFLQKRDYKNAILLAMRLDQPFRLLKILQDVSLAHKDPDSILGLSTVDRIIAELSDKHLAQLLRYIRSWNTHNKHARIAQSLLHVILKSYSPERLLKIPKCKEIIDALLAYTDRHLKIADGLVVQSYVVDYTIGSMTGFDNIDDEA